MSTVIIAPNWLGDAVMALPAISDLRRHFADVRFAVAARRSVAPLFAMVDGVDEVVTLPGAGGWWSLSTANGDVAALTGRFDIAVLLPNSFASALSVHRAGIAERWGFATDFRSRFLTRAVPRPKGIDHHAAYYQALVSALGITTGPQFAAVHARRASTDMAPAPSDPYVVLAPGAAYGAAKQWLPERFAELAALVANELEWSVAIVGSGADAAVCRQIAASAGSGRVVNLCGQTDLAGLVRVLAGARAVVSNDSGAMHLAGAVGARVVAVFGATNEHRTSPLRAGPDAPAAVILTHEVWCRPCMLRECPIDHRCMTGIGARRVLDSLRPALSEREPVE